MKEFFSSNLRELFSPDRGGADRIQWIAAGFKMFTGVPWRGTAFDRCPKPDLIAQTDVYNASFLSGRLPRTSHGVVFS
jgi:hypothetical protein